MTKTAVITGASGALAPSLVSQLLQAGYAVRGVDRALPQIALPAGMTFLQGEIDDPLLADRAMEGADYVFHLAAKLHLNNPSPALEAEYRRVNVEGTRIWNDAAQRGGVKRFVLFSTICVYGASSRGEVLDETSPLKADTLYARTKVEAEQIVLQNPAGTVLRLAAVYGPRMKGNYTKLIEAIRRGRMVMIGSGKNRRTLIHSEDVARAALTAAEHPAAKNAIFNVTDGTTPALRDIIAAIASGLGKKTPRWQVPALIARLLARGVDLPLALSGRTLRVAPLVEKFLEDVAVSGEKLMLTTGFRPSIELQKGWEELLR